MRILTDTDRMPFGKYKDELLQDVPADYFHFLWHNGMKDKVAVDSIARYISDNIHALKKENGDLIWS